MDITDLGVICREIIYLNTCKETGSMNKAAKLLNTHQPVVSNAIRHLEKHTGNILMYRTSSGVKLTKDGELLCKKAAALYDLENYLDNFVSETQRAEGKVTLWTTDGIGGWYIPLKLSEFYNDYPKLSLNIICSEELPDMEKGQADVAVIYEEPVSDNSTVISKQKMRFGLCASQAFLDKYGTPKDLNDCMENFYICNRDSYNLALPEWGEVMRKSKHIKLSTNSSSVLMRVARDGIGISLQPLIVIKADDNLINVLPEFSMDHDFWIVGHVDTKDFPKVRALINYIKEINSTF